MVGDVHRACEEATTVHFSTYAQDYDSETRVRPLSTQAPRSGARPSFSARKVHTDARRWHARAPPPRDEPMSAGTAWIWWKRMPSLEGGFLAAAEHFGGGDSTSKPHEATVETPTFRSEESTNPRCSEARSIGRGSSSSVGSTMPGPTARAARDKRRHPCVRKQIARTRRQSVQMACVSQKRARKENGEHWSGQVGSGERWHTSWPSAR